VSGPGSAQTPWGVHERKGKKEGLKERGREVAWTPKIYDRSPSLLFGAKHET